MPSTKSLEWENMPVPAELKAEISAIIVKALGIQLGPQDTLSLAQWGRGQIGIGRATVKLTAPRGLVMNVPKYDADTGLWWCLMGDGIKYAKPGSPDWIMLDAPAEAPPPPAPPGAAPAIGQNTHAEEQRKKQRGRPRKA